MRIFVCAILFLALVMPVFAARTATARDLPACNAEVMTRRGNEIAIGLQQLGNMANQKLRAAGSPFSELRLAAEGHKKLKISGKKNNTHIAISGPLQVVAGALKLHADHIAKDGDSEKGLMDFFGKDLADYAHFNQTDILSVRDNDLFIHPDPLLNVSGAATSVWLDKSKIILKFAGQPCR